MARTRPTPPPLPPPPPPPRLVESDDQFLRRTGFVIVARPANGPARWRRGRLVLTHPQALDVARREADILKEKFHG